MMIDFILIKIIINRLEKVVERVVAKHETTVVYFLDGLEGKK